jgi:hypothetical protein
VERGRLAERRAEGSLGLPVELDEDRANLKADVPRFEERQPRLCEDIRLTETLLTVRELHQQIVVGIGDHVLTILSAMDRLELTCVGPSVR